MTHEDCVKELDRQAEEAKRWLAEARAAEERSNQRCAIHQFMTPDGSIPGTIGPERKYWLR